MKATWASTYVGLVVHPVTSATLVVGKSPLSSFSRVVKRLEFGDDHVSERLSPETDSLVERTLYVPLLLGGSACCVLPVCKTLAIPYRQAPPLEVLLRHIQSETQQTAMLAPTVEW